MVGIEPCKYGLNRSKTATEVSEWGDGQLLRVLHGRAKAVAATLASLAAKRRNNPRTRDQDLGDVDRAVTYVTNNHQTCATAPPERGCSRDRRISMPIFRHDGAELFFTDEGEGPAVLLLHGWACDSHDWSWQIPVLLDAYRVIALDHRGHGRSSAPTGPYRPQVLADDAAALLRHLGVGPAVAVGHSMGTVVTSALSVRHPELLHALVLVDPVYNTPDAALAPVLGAMRGPAPLAAAAAMFEAAFYTPTSPPNLPTWHRRRLLGTPQHVVTGCILGLYDGENGIGRGEVAATYLKARRHPRLTVHASQAAADFEKVLPTSEHDEIHLWEGAGHFLHQERPEAFNHLLLDWLDRHQAA